VYFGREVSLQPIGGTVKQIIDAVIAKTGIDPEKAKDAVETVLGFLREKLPAPLAAKLEELVGGEDGERPDGDGGGLDVGGMIGGLFK
jgi:hypothetical protein